MSVIKLSSPATREFWEIPVLFEDAHLLALDKPSGLLTSPDQNDVERASLMKLLHEGIAAKKPWATERNLDYLNAAHRLDAETGGVILLAKNKEVFIALTNLFSMEKPQKTDLALIATPPPADRFEVDARLSQHPVIPGMMCVDSKDGKKSKTRFEVAEKFSHYALINCHPLTDRTHQVRIHLRHAGFPVIGDKLYGGKPLWLSRLKKDYRLKPGREERPLLARPAIHSAELTLPHPVTGEVITIKAELPKDMRVAIRYLREFAGTGRVSEE